MIVSLSERRVSELIRSLENINDSDSEIAFRMQHYAAKLFTHVNDGYGVKFVGMSETHGDIGSFKFDIHGCKDFHGQIDWNKLVGGLQFLNPLCVSVEPEDVTVICDKLIGNQALAAWPEYEATLQRITPGELQSRIEAALMKYVWNRPIETNAMTPTDKALRELQIQEEFGKAGLTDPLLRLQAVADFREKQEREYQAAKDARHRAFYE